MVPSGMEPFGRGRPVPAMMSSAINWETGDIVVPDDILERRKLMVELTMRCSGPLDGPLSREDQKMLARLFFVDDPTTQESAWGHACRQCVDGPQYTLGDAVHEIAPATSQVTCPPVELILRAMKHAGDRAVARGVYDVVLLNSSEWDKTFRKDG